MANLQCGKRRSDELQFTWFEDLFAKDAYTPDFVNVASKAYRRVALYEPGEYEAVLSYNGTNTTASWLVRDIDEVRKTKNVLLFIGDGMTTNMVSSCWHSDCRSRRSLSLDIGRSQEVAPMLTFLSLLRRSQLLA